MQAQVSLTYRCNLKCRHCYLGSLREQKQDEEMGFSFIKDILTQLSQAGYLWLALSGGEPLLREDFPEIYRDAKSKGFLITILTNATLITPAYIELFREYPPFYLDITINALSPNLYDEICQVQGANEKLLDGLHLLRAGNIPFKLKANLMRINSQEIANIKKLTERWGVPFNVDPVLFPCLDKSTTPEVCRSSDGAQNPHLRCAAGKFSVHIDNFGMLRACEFLREPAFDLKRRSLEEGLTLIAEAVKMRSLKKVLK